jgi:hypothetical protein
VLGSPVAANRSWLATKAAVMPPLALVRARQPVATSAALLAAVRAGHAAPAIRLPSDPVERPPLDLEADYRRFVAAATEGRTPQ